MRRLLVLASAMVFFDVAFYAAIAPLLPDYVARFDLSKTEAGMLTGSYAAGTLIASLPAGFVATRVGPRRTVVGGLLALGASSVVFGFGDDIAVLDAARFVQGASGALIWSGALTWMVTNASQERRGSVIGNTLGMAIAGALVGPLLGALAAEVGTKLVFSGVMGAAVVLAAVAASQPELGVPERQALRDVGGRIASRPAMAATAFVAVPSVMFGTIGVLVPLRISQLGGGHTIIAAGFIAGAALEGILAPLVGRYSDRVGRRLPIVVGIAICAGAMVGIALAQQRAPLIAALVVGSLGSGICFTPAMTALSETAESIGLHQGLASGLSNMAWASGQVVGALAGGGIASAAGYAVPSFCVAGLLLLTAAYANRFLDVPAVRVAEGTVPP